MRASRREVTVPLSEHEQRLLEQMERALYAEDPKFATSMRNPNPLSGDKRRIALGVVAFLAGLGLLIAGVATKLVPVGVLGFLAMLAGIWFVVTSTRPSGTAAAAQATGGPAQAGPTRSTTRSTRVGGVSPPRARRARSSESFTEKMERRWRRRRETGDF
jgi:Protein of unknown function (DUF3040)